MDLDPQIAETIVANLKDIIQHEINLFDTTGTIIASTDRTRIGTSHDGARLAISTRDTVCIDSEHEFKGAKHGINAPVLFNGSVVAVIGITGERTEVEPFGNVIKKMTEILIRENWEQITRFDQRERLTSLVNMLNLRHHDAGFVDYLASVLEIDLQRPRRAVVGRLSVSPDATPSHESPYELLYARFQQAPHSFFSVSAQEICMFVDAEDERCLPSLLRGIESDVKLRLRQRIAFGIGTVSETSTEYWRSYDEAEKTVEWLLFTGEGTQASFVDMDYGIFLSSIPRREAEQLEHRVFGCLPNDEIDGFREIFDAYTRHNGSIVHCADELFLHKNTLQNRLNRIAKKTGYNPRELGDYAVLSIAFKLREYTRFRREQEQGIKDTRGQTDQQPTRASM